MVILFIQSSFGQIEIPDFNISWFDKILHFVVFGILGILTARGFKHSSNQLLKQNFFRLGILASVIYGMTDEIHQHWVPGRDASSLDLLADILGIILFVWIYKRYVTDKTSENKKLSENRSVI